MGAIQPIIEQLSRARATLEAAAAAVPAERWRIPPRPGAWSAAEVIAHLMMVEGRIAGGAAKLLLRTHRPVPFWKRFHLPVRLGEWRWPKVRSPVPLDPALLADKDEMLARFAALRQRTLILLEENRDRDLGAYRWPHPFFGQLNFYEWFRSMAYHELRHTKQIREIVNSFQR